MSENSCCVFCQAKFPTRQRLTDHLDACGKKTDQCPNCKRNVQRAVFAYHYENSCAELEGFKTEKKPAKPRGKPETNASRSVSDIMQCEFCNSTCARKDYTIHKQHCGRNPANVQDTSKSQQDHGSADTFYIPCEFCNKDIQGAEYERHQRTCSSSPNNHQSPREQNRRERETSTVTCEYCHRKFDQGTFVYHQNNCSYNSRSSQNQLPSHLIGNDGVTRVLCQHCQARIEYPNLQDHEIACKLSRGTMNDSNQQADQRTTNQYWCQYCRTSFERHEALLNHLNSCFYTPRNRSYADAARNDGDISY